MYAPAHPNPIFRLSALFLGALFLTSTPFIPEASAQRLELDVPLVQQWGDRNNCGPSAAAMVLGAYRFETRSHQLKQLRDSMGTWSWNAFSLRRFQIPGVPGGWTTPKMLAAMLNRFSYTTRFQAIQMGVPLWEKWVQIQLKNHIKAKRPVIVLVQADILWPGSGPGLHWVVITGIGKNAVIINDPADKSRAQFPIKRFMKAWKMEPAFRALPFVAPYSAVVADAPLPPKLVATR